MDAYRDPLAALRSQIALMRTVNAEAERRVPPLALTMLSGEDAAELGQLRAASAEGPTASEDATVESLCEVERCLDALHAFFQRIEALWKLPAEPVPTEAPPEPWGDGMRGMTEVRAALESSFGDGTAERFGPDAFRVRFLDEDALFVLIADAFPTERNGFVEIGHLALILRASMPSSLPTFELGPEMDVGAYQNRIRSPHWVHGAIPKRPKRQLPAERAFWISGNQIAAASLVDDEVHEALVDLLATCVLEAPSARVYPSLRAGAGFVEIGYTRGWQGDDTDWVAEEALGIAHRMRRVITCRTP